MIPRDRTRSIREGRFEKRRFEEERRPIVEEKKEKRGGKRTLEVTPFRNDEVAFVVRDINLKKKPFFFFEVESGSDEAGQSNALLCSL